MPAAACNWPTKLFVKQFSKPIFQALHADNISFPFIYAALLLILCSSTFSSSPGAPKAGCKPGALQMPHRLKVWTQVCHILLSSHLYSQFSVNSMPTLAGTNHLLWFKNWTMILHEKHPRTWDVYSNPSSWTAQTLQPHKARLLDVWACFCFVLFPFWQLGFSEIRHWNTRSVWSEYPITIRVRMGPSAGGSGSAREARPGGGPWWVLCFNSTFFILKPCISRLSRLFFLSLFFSPLLSLIIFLFPWTRIQFQLDH